MSAGTRRPWAEAAAIARPLAEQLIPLCEPGRVKLAGSLRRKRSEVGDIEIVAHPRMITPPAAAQEGLFSPEPVAEPLVPDLDGVRAVVRDWGTLLKCGDRFIQAVLDDKTVVDVFLVHPPAQWGSILAIRTGPAELGELAVTRMRDAGLRHVSGHVEDSTGRVIPTPDEETFFRLAGLPCLPPEERDTTAARRPVAPATAAPVPAPAPAAAGEAATRERAPRQRWTGDLGELRALLTAEAAASPHRRAWRALRDGTLVAVLHPIGEQPAVRIARDTHTLSWDDDVTCLAFELGVSTWDRVDEGEGSAVAVRFREPVTTVPCRGGCGGVGSLQKATFVGFCTPCTEKRWREGPWGGDAAKAARLCARCGNPIDSGALLFGKEPLRCAQCLMKERRAPAGAL